MGKAAKVASHLCESYEYPPHSSNGLKYRFRYVIASKEPNDFYQARGVKYLTYADMVRFLVEERAKCWTRANIGIASVHYQWDPLINQILEISSVRLKVE